MVSRLALLGALITFFLGIRNRKLSWIRSGGIMLVARMFQELRGSSKPRLKYSKKLNPGESLLISHKKN